MARTRGTGADTHPRRGSHRSGVGGRRGIVFALLAVFVLGCGAQSLPVRADGVSPPVGADDDAVAATSQEDGPQVVVEGRDLLLRTGATQRHLATLTADDGEVVRTTLRPGEHRDSTVLLLTRVDDADHGARYELRYLVAYGDGSERVTDLYWFPWRLGIAEEHAEIDDTPPLPVWAPDGDALAWIEWTTDGVRLRTVGWFDDGYSVNPSDDAVAYRLRDVPVGTQLVAWEEAGAEPAFLARHPDEGTPYRIVVSTRDVAAV